MKSDLLSFLRARGAISMRHGSRTIFRHCSVPSNSNPMSCIHGQPWLTVATFDSVFDHVDGTVDDAIKEKKSTVIGMYSSAIYGGPAVLRHPEIMYNSCEHCDVPVSYIDDVDGIRVTADVNAVVKMSHTLLKKIKLMEVYSVFTEMPCVAV